MHYNETAEKHWIRQSFFPQSLKSTKGFTTKVSNITEKLARFTEKLIAHHFKFCWLSQYHKCLFI